MEEAFRAVVFEQVKAVLLGRFLDETAGIYTASRQERSALVITDGLESIEHLSDGARA